MMQDALECWCNSSVCPRKIRWLFFQNRAHRFSGRTAMKCTLTRKHLVKDRAKGEDVRTMVNYLPSHLLWRHVASCSHYHAWIGIDSPSRNVCLYLAVVGLRELGKTKVQNIEAAVFCNE